MDNTIAETKTPEQTRLTISIAMATYNGAKYIREQLDSLAAQTLLPDELVITDDGSTDETIAIIEDFAKTATFKVRLYRNETRLGYSNNFFKATSFCIGDLIAFCDQDDVWLPEKLQICASYFCDNDILLCVHSSRIWFGGSEFRSLLPNIRRKQIFESGEAGPIEKIIGMSMIFRKELLSKLDYTNRPKYNDTLEKTIVPMSHDWWVWFTASTFGKIIKIPNILVYYRQHGNNTVGIMAPSLAKKIVSAPLKFTDMKDFNLSCIHYVSSAIRCEKTRQINRQIDDAIQLLEHCAKLYDLRAKIYGIEDSTFFRRFFYLLQISRLSGYNPNNKFGIFGYRAFLKDAFFALPGIFKYAAAKALSQ